MDSANENISDQNFNVTSCEINCKKLEETNEKKMRKSRNNKAYTQCVNCQGMTENCVLCHANTSNEILRTENNSIIFENEQNNVTY